MGPENLNPLSRREIVCVMMSWKIVSELKGRRERERHRDRERERERERERNTRTRTGRLDGF
jgi:hypothetical protein